MTTKLLSLVYKLILWYSAIIVFVFTFRHSYNLLFIQELSSLILGSVFIIIGLVFLFSFFKLIIAGFHKKYFLVLSTFWISQVIYFGISGFVFIHMQGPVVAFFVNLTEGFNYGMSSQIWANDFLLRLFTSSNSVYFGINIIPLVIVILLYQIWKESAGKKSIPFLHARTSTPQVFLTIVGIYQIAGSLYGLYFLFFESFHFIFRNPFLFLVFILIFSFGTYCGVMLFSQDKLKGVNLSLFNQSFQFIQFYISGYGLSYISGTYLAIGFTTPNLRLLYDHQFIRSIFSYTLAGKENENYIFINLVAFLVFLLLLFLKELDMQFPKQEKI